MLIADADVFTYQPQYPAEINWDDPITAGLVRVDNFALRGADMLGGPAWATNSFLPSEKGIALAQQGDATDKNCTGSGLHLKIITGVTVLSLVHRKARPSAADFYYGHNTGTAYNWGLYDSGSTNVRYFWCKNISGTAVSPSYTAAASGWAVMVGAYSEAGGQVKLYENGILKAQTALTGQIQQNDYLLSSFDYGSGTATYRQPLALVWNRELTAEEVQRISANPWLIFRQEEEEIFFPVASAPAGTVNLTGVGGEISLSCNDGVITQTQVLTGDSCTVNLESSTAVVNQSQNLTGSSCTVALSCNEGSIGLEGAVVLTGVGGEIILESSAGVITQVYSLVGAGSTVNTESSTGVITQDQILTGVGGSCNLSCTSGAITIGTVPVEPVDIDKISLAVATNPKFLALMEMMMS